MNSKLFFSLRTKLTLLTIMLVAAVAMTAMTITASKMRDTLTTEIKEKGIAIAKGMAHASEDALVGTGDELYLFQFTSSAMKNRGVEYAIVVGSDGTVRAHSDTMKSGKAYEPLAGLKDAEAGEGYTIGMTPGNAGYIVFDISVPITMAGSDDRVLGVAHLGLSDRVIEEAVSKMRRRVMEIGVVALFLGGVGAFTLATYFVSPIKLLVDGVNEVGKGNLDQEIKVDRRDEVGELTNAFNQMTRGLREKEFIKNTFERYMSKQLAEKLLGDHDKMTLELGGEHRFVTILFTDIRGFTTMSEKLDPKSVISFLNEYFSTMVDVVFEYNGWIDKFIGDAMMVIYGLPIKAEDDAVRAVRTGLRMKDAMRRFNEKRVAEGHEPMHIGIGINTGTVVAGNVGSESRMNYTVVGDAVNLAARLVPLSKTEEIIISQYTYDLVKDRFTTVKLGMVSLKGKHELQQVYEVTGEK
ncbi:MAG: HAMP domain-containing protein [Nitrospirae bacterium]|nr:HAMP domain-containing protein [Nitrospirota bacterium]MBI5695210.1 HAMP domain-containing protein [Nitrospirota bacterium]